MARDELIVAQQAAENAAVQKQIEYREYLDSQHGFPELPRIAADGRTLDSKYFRSIPAAEFHRWVKNYGFAQLTKRINEVQGA
jgi:hypothetical protein